MTILSAATVIAWLFSIVLGLSALRCRGMLRKLRRGMAAVICAALGILLGGLLILLQGFSAFTAETLVATVTTRRLAPDAFELIYTPTDSSERPLGPLQMQGDQWAFSGGIVKWHPWLTALGFRSSHRPMRISGQFSRLDQQRARPPTVYPVGPLIDRVWEAFYRADPYLPFVEAVYGSSAYVYVEPGVAQEVYVTSSGYLIKRSHP